jgi:hypothetical protein
MNAELGQLWRHRSTGSTLKVVYVGQTDVCLDDGEGSQLHVLPRGQLELSWMLLA